MAVNRLHTRERIPQLDYLKGVFILLMVLFHLELTEQTYPLLCKAVYTFHMSAFLIISGYLANVDRKPCEFGHGLMRIVLPYVLFESLYIMAQYFWGGTLHSHNAIDRLTVGDFTLRLATLPTGPYWYLHTLAICMVLYWLVYRVFRLKGIGALALMGLSLFALSVVIEGLTWCNVIYFLIGVFIFRNGKQFMDVITPSWLALLPLIVLFWFPENYDRGTLAGIAITILVISVLLALFPYLLQQLRQLFCYIGRNSLAIVVFSPMFTILTKKVAPFFSFDPTAVCFALCALTFVVAASLTCAWLSDKLKLSRFVFFKEIFYSPYGK